MEVKSTEELRALIKKEIYDQRLSVAGLARQADTAQPGLNQFVNGTNGMNTNTMFSVLSVLGIVLDAKSITDEKSLEKAFLEMSRQPLVLVKKPSIPDDFKEKLADAFRFEIESYMESNDPKKPKFTIDYIVELLGKAFDKTATV